MNNDESHNSKINGMNRDINAKQYDLSAIVIHSGSSAEYGHYYTYAKDEGHIFYLFYFLNCS